MFTDWSERARDREWCAAKLWLHAMRDNFIDKPEVIEEPETLEPEASANIDTEAEAALKRSERSKKSAATLLARNPNYYKELSLKAHTRLEQNIQNLQENS